MPTVISLANAEDVSRSGGKAVNLGHMLRRGIDVPPGVVVPVGVYRRYMAQTGLAERVSMELARKPMEQMRWEELWDAALRIRHLFDTTALPPGVHNALATDLSDLVDTGPVVVRSSAPQEDAQGGSFAGLHESYVNLVTIDSVLEHIRRVWASLFSDRALLYRQELGLSVESSGMAVVVQRIVVGRCSGICFSTAPDDASTTMVEAAWGLNQGLVDGDVDADRWRIDRDDRHVIEHTPPPQRRRAVPQTGGVAIEQAPPELAGRPPLGPDELARVVRLGQHLETLFNAPQDVEWTFIDDRLVCLQARPITTGTGDDKRSWYLSLSRSFDNLLALWTRIENEVLPGMDRDAERLRKQDLSAMDDHSLAEALRRRKQVLARWVEAYWETCIPFAHGVRLFGQVYNDTVKPDDPYRFVQLLARGNLQSLERNRELAELARAAAETPDRQQAFCDGRWEDLDDPLRRHIDALIRRFGRTLPTEPRNPASRRAWAGFVMRLAETEPRQAEDRSDCAALEREFLECFQGDRRDWARRLLELARNSYRLRDDDNLVLARVEACLDDACTEARRRLVGRGFDNLEAIEPPELARALNNPDYTPTPPEPEARPSTGNTAVRARQLVGQAAGPGIVTAVARVVRSRDELFEFCRGEVLVCDAVSPDMTFVAPLAAAVVERRGGMLIHGAIIAREYGLPCVTGIPDADHWIASGQTITVDGYLGIVTLGEQNIEKGKE